MAELREARTEDLEMVARLERRHGTSPALEAMERHLQDRLASLDASAAPQVPDVPAENQELFRRHRDAIDSIEKASRNPLHEIISEPGEGPNRVEEDGRPVLGSPRPN